MSGSEPMRLERFCKQYGCAQAAHDVSVHVEASEFVSFLGPSGSGKTTTLTVLVRNTNSLPDLHLSSTGNRASSAHAKHRGVFQNYALFLISVFEDVAFARRRAGHPAPICEPASLGITIWRIVFPLIRPALIVAGFFAFLASFDEVLLALFLSGPNTVTLPIKMWSGIREEITPTIAAVSSLLIAFTILVYTGVETVRQAGQRRPKKASQQ
ncbi:ATP-binding cassette domain-containing protein [Bradyrhizobium diazoefficiens]|nr:ATP-binding cassette domain-containing protein [Bradyrhizobium diazoefficiens]QQO23775.1 ATP-binding cassette domain-containing protein [Bradyrhizobium diazoefficiens]